MKPRNTEYSEKLRDPRWQKKRLLILERDDWTCQLCLDNKSTLHVHHRWYLSGREPWDYPDAGLVTLCETCHETETQLTISGTHDLPLIAKQAGAMGCELDELCGVLSLVISTPLDAVEWSVLTSTIRSLLLSRFAGSPAWQEARDRYFDGLREAANKNEGAVCQTGSCEKES